jgi:hypothetical protein
LSRRKDIYSRILHLLIPLPHHIHLQGFPSSKTLLNLLEATSDMAPKFLEGTTRGGIGCMGIVSIGALLYVRCPPSL